MRERAARLVALALVGLAIVLVNWDPELKWLPGLGQGAGLVSNETAKQSLVLAGALIVLGLIGGLWVWWRGSDPAIGFAAVMGSSAVAAVVVFLIVISVEGDNRGWFALSNLVVVIVATAATLLGRPSFSYGNLSSIPILATIGALVLLVAYGVVLYFMFANSGTTVPNQWERMIAIFGGVQSIAFAAAGALLGSTVQKSQTDAQGSRADDNKALGNHIAELALSTAASGDGGDAGGAAAPNANQQAIEILRQQLR